MDELTRELAVAREEFAPRWNADRAAQLYSATQQRGRRRVVRRAAVSSLAAAGAVAALVIGVQSGREARTPATGTNAVAHDSAAQSGHLLRLEDGSRAELVGESSDLAVVENGKQRVSLRLVAGHARFDVVPNPQRSFVVEAGPYRVEVIGTSFEVERHAREVLVAVTRGKVRVYGPNGAVDLGAGVSQRFAVPDAPSLAPAVVPAHDAIEDEPAVATETSRVRSRSKRAAASGQSSWRSLTQSGQYDAAFALMQEGTAIEDDPATLMDAADAARLSGHPLNAVQYLERVVRDHGKSPVAPLAAFTLGRVYLDKLGQPEKAARSFESARRLAPNGSLAQDALAREVEALSKGGSAQKAYQRAREYLQLYPDGRRVRAVQLYGGLD